MENLKWCAVIIDVGDEKQIGICLDAEVECDMELISTHDLPEEALANCERYSKEYGIIQFGDVVDIKDACPNCDNREVDFLEWQDDDETIVCLKCGNEYKLEDK